MLCNGCYTLWFNQYSTKNRYTWDDMLDLRNYEYNMLEAMNICICYEYICHSYITVRVGYLLLLHESDRGEAEGES